MLTNLHTSSHLQIISYLRLSSSSFGRNREIAFSLFPPPDPGLNLCLITNSSMSRSTLESLYSQMILGSWRYGISREIWFQSVRGYRFPLSASCKEWEGGRRGRRSSHLVLSTYLLYCNHWADSFTYIGFWDRDAHTLQVLGCVRFGTLSKVTQLIGGWVLPQVMPSQLSSLFTLPHGGSFCPHLSGTSIYFPLGYFLKNEGTTSISCVPSYFDTNPP